MNIGKIKNKLLRRFLVITTGAVSIVVLVHLYLILNIISAIAETARDVLKMLSIIAKAW